LILLFGGSSLLLLIAALNASWLILARNDSRRREMAIRRALGARSGTLFRQFLVEGLLLVGAGLTLSLLLCWSSLRLLSLSPADGDPFPDRSRLNLASSIQPLRHDDRDRVFGAAPRGSRAGKAARS
jgi:ABC-type antimicrobial peptide transport system permease subunit